jgi:hypothetical protein
MIIICMNITWNNDIEDKAEILNGASQLGNISDVVPDLSILIVYAHYIVNNELHGLLLSHIEVTLAFVSTL